MGAQKMDWGVLCGYMVGHNLAILQAPISSFQFYLVQIDVVLRTNYQTTSEGLLLSGVRIYIVPPMAVRIVTRLRYLNNNHDSDST